MAKTSIELISCVLTISASGSLTKTYIIIKGLKKPPKVNVLYNLFVLASKSGFLDASLMVKHLKEIIEPISKNKGEIILMMDDLRFNAHRTDKVLDYMKLIKLFLSDFIPTYLLKSEKLHRISTHHLNFQKNIEKNIEKNICIGF